MALRIRGKPGESQTDGKDPDLDLVRSTLA